MLFVPQSVKSETFELTISEPCFWNIAINGQLVDFVLVLKDVVCDDHEGHASLYVLCEAKESLI